MRLMLLHASPLSFAYDRLHKFCYSIDDILSQFCLPEPERTRRALLLRDLYITYLTRAHTQVHKTGFRTYDTFDAEATSQKSNH